MWGVQYHRLRRRATYFKGGRCYRGRHHFKVGYPQDIVPSQITSWRLLVSITGISLFNRGSCLHDLLLLSAIITNYLLYRPSLEPGEPLVPDSMMGLQRPGVRNERFGGKGPSPYPNLLSSTSKGSCVNARRLGSSLPSRILSPHAQSVDPCTVPCPRCSNRSH